MLLDEISSSVDIGQLHISSNPKFHSPTSVLVCALEFGRKNMIEVFATTRNEHRRNFIHSAVETRSLFATHIIPLQHSVHFVSQYTAANIHSLPPYPRYPNTFAVMCRIFVADSMASLFCAGRCQLSSEILIDIRIFKTLSAQLSHFSLCLRMSGVDSCV
jgi:hypothetical protein